MKNNMKKIKLYGLIFLGLTLIIPAATKAANTPSGISNDYYIKLQEEKSALEYRISSLETSSYNSPDLSSLNIQSRIDELIRERETEKNYITGLYGKNGISNQLPSALATIDSKYQSQIDNLNQQKAYYQNQISSQQSSTAELSQTKLRIQELDKLLAEQEKLIQSLKTQMYVPTNPSVVQTPVSSVNGTPTASDVFNYIDSLSLYDATVALEAIKTNALPMYTEVIKLAEAKYVKGYTTPTAMAIYADSLPENEVSKLWTKLGLYNPTLRDQTNIIVKNKYPDGKFLNPAELKQQQIEASLKQTPKVTAPATTKKVTSVNIEPKIEKQEVATTTLTQQTATAPSSTPQTTEVKPQKKSFIQKTFDFFKSFAFWR